MNDFRTLPITLIDESPNNPRCHFDAKGMEDLVASVRAKGILAPLLVRSIDGRFEILDGARRFRAANAAGVAEVPARVCDVSDKEALEIQIIANLQREDVHPLDEANGYRRLIDRAGYDVPGIAAKVGKSESYVYQRLKLADLVDLGQQAFWDGKITAGHAILIARLQPKDQQRAIKECQPPDWAPQRVKSVRDLADWIRSNVHLELVRAPFSVTDAELLPAAGACFDCPKRTGANPALFEDIADNLCTDPACYRKKVDAQLERKRMFLSGQGEFVQITEGWKSKKPDVLSKARWNEVDSNDKGTSVKSALIVDGPNKGKVIRVLIEPEKPAAPSHEEQRKRLEEKAARETAIRSKILDAILAKVRWPLNRGEIEALIFELSDRYPEKLCARHGMKCAPSRSEAAVRELAAKSSEDELAKLIVEALLVGDTVVGAFGYESKPALLMDAVKRYKVNADKIRDQALAEIKARAKADRKPTEKVVDGPGGDPVKLTSRKLTMAERKRIAAAQKKRWALHRKQVAANADAGGEPAPEVQPTPAGKRRIAAARKALGKVAVPAQAADPTAAGPHDKEKNPTYPMLEVWKEASKLQPGWPAGENK